MASFASNSPTQFNPYISQLPIVEEMSKVGLEKQGKYDQGIQRIQTQIDNVAGMDVMKDVDKQYLQSKMGELGNNLKYVAAGDFSNYQLTNSVGGMVNQIGKDENIQNAVYSTIKYRKESAMMDTDRKAGKLTPDNEYLFNKQAGEWLNNPDIKSSFRGSYVPHFDIFKFAKETFDEILPDGMTFDQIYQIGADGKPITDKRGNLVYSPTMTRMEKEGRMPEKVQQTIAQIFSDPRVNRQLNITGQYNYRGASPEQLSEKIGYQKDQILSNYKIKMDDLILQKSLGKNVQKEIDNLQSGMTTVSANYDRYAKSAYTDPDGVRGMLYSDDVSSRYTTMFGQIKTKEQVMENPGWRSQFDMQKEANAQSRWSQDLAQRKLEHRDEQSFRTEKLKQDADIAADKLIGSNRSNSFEQGNQFSDIDVIRLQETNFDKAASDFTNSSDAMIWQTVFNKDPINQNKVKTLMSNGLSREQAISATIDNLATQQKEDPQIFRTNWLGKSTVEFNKLSPIEKEKNSLINDSYNLYKKSKRIFDNELIIKKRIDQETTKNLGEVGKQLSTMDIKPQTITYLDKSYELTKSDIFDLAIYNKGRLAKLNAIVNPEEARIYEHESENALQRLTQRGKGNLVEAFIEDEQSKVNASGIPVNIKDVYRGLRYNSEGFGSNRDWSQVKKVQDVIANKEYNEAMTKKADIIKESYGTRPNLKSGVLTGDTKIDNNILYNIKRWAGNYGTSNQNLSGDFDNFRSSLSDDLTKNNLEMSVIMDANNNPQIEIISYGEKNKRIGGMTIQPDEASRLGININDIYENREVSSLRSKINSNNNRTSIGDPSELSTYLSGDSYYSKNDFPNLSKSNRYDVQANIIYSNGKYYPYVFMTDGTKSTIEQLDGDPSLQKVIISLQNGITPGLVEQYLIEK